MNAVVPLFPGRFGPLIFGLILVTSACSSRNAGREASSGSAERAADQPDGMRSTSEWPAYNGGYDATRFSPVT